MLPAAALLADEKGTILAATPALARLLGRERLTGQSLSRVLPDEKARAALWTAIQTGPEVETEQILTGGLRTWTGAEVPAEIGFTVLDPADGRVLLAVIRDFRIRSQAEDLLAMLLDALPLVMFECDRQGVYRAVRGNNRDPRRVVGARAQDLWRDQPDVLAAIRKVWRGKRARGTNVGLHGHVMQFWLEPILDEQGTVVGMRGLSYDVSERFEAERARAANAAKTRFLAAMSHELRTPLNSILGFSQLLEGATGLTSRQREYLGYIRHSGRHLLGVINDLLDLSKIEAGQMAVAPSPLDLKQALVGSAAEIAPLAREKSIRLRTSCPAGIRILADRLRLDQVLLNLLNNAVKFTPEGGTVEVSAAGDTTVAVIEVRDTGIGIASEDLEHVFEEFYQAEAGRAQGRAGTGLGLPLARHLAELQDGALTCTSTVGEGSTFRLTLPLEGPGCGRRKVRDCAADLSPDLDLGPAA